MVGIVDSLPEYIESRCNQHSQTPAQQLQGQELGDAGAFWLIRSVTLAVFRWKLTRAASARCNQATHDAFVICCKADSTALDDSMYLTSWLLITRICISLKWPFAILTQASLPAEAASAAARPRAQTVSGSMPGAGWVRGALVIRSDMISRVSLVIAQWPSVPYICRHRPSRRKHSQSAAPLVSRSVRLSMSAILVSSCPVPTCQMLQRKAGAALSLSDAAAALSREGSSLIHHADHVNEPCQPQPSRWLQAKRSCADHRPLEAEAAKSRTLMARAERHAKPGCWLQAYLVKQLRTFTLSRPPKKRGRGRKEGTETPQSCAGDGVCVSSPRPVPSSSRISVALLAKRYAAALLLKCLLRGPCCILHAVSTAVIRLSARPRRA
ncbi:hypothetical protein V8C26DRAFT_121658 [Trichoderma gracile]